MIRDHRPFAVKKAYRRFEEFYVRHFLRPQLEHLGDHFTFIRPWHVEVFGGPVRIGRCVNVIAARDMKVRLAVWSEDPGRGGIFIGDYCLLCPGVRIGSAAGVFIGDGTMLANGAYITDSDWHDLYNRIRPCPNPSPVILEENVWIGDGAVVCKGVTIGRNSVIGAGAVVTTDVPESCVAAGNPARVVKRLDPGRPLVTRAEWFRDPARLHRDIEHLDRRLLRGNTFRGWLRHKFFPARGE
ncbi:MAG: acyltransferase [Thermodesulfobacteriota bacterium]